VRAPLPAALVVRRGWRRLISMRTALVLLFLLALASVPGSLLPQRPLNPTKVDAYLAGHGTWGQFLDRIGAFDVFGSFWFAAVYLLLFASLVGCLIPRIRVYARALRAEPIRAPRHLDRLAESGSLTSPLTPEQSAAAAVALLRPRWRAVTRTEDSGAVTVSAEKGYSREAGNLLFHVSLLLALVLIAGGRLLSYQGSVVLTEGSGFCNVLPSYDSFHSGRWVDKGALAPFCVDRLNSFTAAYREDNTPSQFKADVTYSLGLNGTGTHDVIAVNHPLRTGGDRVYLINHGFSPTVTVTRPGQAARTQTQAFLPQDGFLTSEGAMKFSFPGTGQDVGLQGIFAPTAIDRGGGVISSASPQVTDPVLALLAYTGDTGLNNGLPQSVYSLDTSKMTKVGGKNLHLGESMKLPDGTTVRFDGYKQWAAMQVSHDPTQTYLLIAAVLMVFGLLGSLVVRRRRVWLRLSIVRPDDEDCVPARTLIEAGGLARSDSGNFDGEFRALLGDLRAGLNADSAVATGAQASRVGAGKD
jgi:cytochrome c biogenesis protein